MTAEPDKLKLLTQEFVSKFPGTFTNSKRMVSFNVRNGVANIEILKKNEEILIVYCECSDGAEMELHDHKEVEIMGVSYGKMLLRFQDGEEAEMSVGQSIEIQQGRAHAVHYIGQTRTWAVLIPCPKDFPNG